MRVTSTGPFRHRRSISPTEMIVRSDREADRDGYERRCRNKAEHDADQGDGQAYEE